MMEPVEIILGVVFVLVCLAALFFLIAPAGIIGKKDDVIDHEARRRHLGN